MYSNNSAFLLHSTNRWLSPSSYWMLDQMTLFKDVLHQQVVYDHRVDPIPKYPPASKQRRLKIGSYHFPLKDKRQEIINASRARDLILFSHFGPRGYHDLKYSSFAKKHIVRFYGYDVHRIMFDNPAWKEKYVSLFKRVDEVWVEGVFMKRSLAKLGCPTHKIHVLPIGIEQINKELKPRENSNPIKILIGGSFKEKKGIDTALKALQVVHKSHSSQKFEVHLIGQSLNATPSDLEYAYKLESILKKCQFTLIRHGFVSRSELRSIAAKCHFGLFPSQWAKDQDCEGGYPILFLECMAQDLPIISTNHCDIPSIVNSDNGEICEEKDIEGIASAILSMFDEEKRMSQAQLAKKNVADKFLWHKLQTEYIKQLLK